MKIFDVKITGKYEKSMTVLAESIEEAKDKTAMILFETDLLDFEDEDFAGGDVDITERMPEDETGTEDAENMDDEDENEEETGDSDGFCRTCRYCCPVCGECMYEGGDSR